MHFLDPSQDTIPSLALRYRVPQDALRRKNGLFADHLLAARKTILIPGEFYKGGTSLSPQPLESEEEEIRKSKIRRWMVACKVSEYVGHHFLHRDLKSACTADCLPCTFIRSRYEIALLYLQQAKYDLDAAVEAYLADEKWEKEHPIAGSAKEKGGRRPARRRLGLSAGLTGQL